VRSSVATAALLAAGLAGRAAAHPLAPALLDVVESAGGRAEVRWKTSTLTVPDAPLRPGLPAACVDRSPRVEAREDASVTTRWTVDCGPAGLVGGTVAVEGLGPARTQALVHLELADGRVVQTVLRAAAPSFVVAARPARLDVFGAYARLGVEHVLTGADHLLFVFGLVLLVPALRALAGTVSAFTVGHSITLSLVALGGVVVPAGPAELFIALTVLGLAVELARPASDAGLLRRRPWLPALGCGLVHGLGFAGALREIGLPAGDVPVALFSFNVGIEAGQLAFVAVVLAAGRAARRMPAGARFVPVYAMGSLAACWCLQRALAVFQ